MLIEKTYSSPWAATLGVVLNKVKDYAEFIKLRLTSLVVFSAASGFVLASANTGIEWEKLFLLIISGMLITGSSNGFNQILERDLDKLMSRTFKRPLPDKRMTVLEGYTLASIMGLSGLAILTLFMNPLCGMLGTLALILYTLVYTPMKRRSTFAVLAGAFPGAIPPMLGWVAVTNSIDTGALVLFTIQFIWQFPHFWSIAWVLDDDYKKAGFRLLPSRKGRGKSSALCVMLYSLCLLPASILPWILGITGYFSVVLAACAGIVFVYHAYRLYSSCNLQSAKKLMLASFVYLPVVLIILIIDKI